MTALHLQLASALAAGLMVSNLAGSQIEIPTARVGNPGNFADITGYGAVNYPFYIGAYEVTNSEYAQFLNSVANYDVHGLFDERMSTSAEGGISRSGSEGAYVYTPKAGMENFPVVYVDFWDACRFANWLTNQLHPLGTETGVYDLTNQALVDGNLVVRNLFEWRSGGVAVASENEWYKAAYYDPSLNAGVGGYWYYPTRSNLPPDDLPPNSTLPNSANHTPPGTLTEVGAYTVASSFYGTYDQGGNVFEWNDTVISAPTRGQRGGSFDFIVDGLDALYRSNDYPTASSNSKGFRVASLERICHPKVQTLIEGSEDGLFWQEIDPGMHEIAAPGLFVRARFRVNGSETWMPIDSQYISVNSGKATFTLSLASSQDLSAWLPDEEVFHWVPDKKFFRLKVEGVMEYLQGGVLPDTSLLGNLSVDSFYIGKFEVTSGEWNTVQAWAVAHGYDIPAHTSYCAEDHPVHSISWMDMLKWCNAKSEMDGLEPCYTLSGAPFRSGWQIPEWETANNGYRLPMEKEWEYAARGGIYAHSAFIYAGSNIIGDVAWHSDNSMNPTCNLVSGRGTWPVGMKAPNTAGLYDMTGNVWEFCWDRRWEESYGRVHRGGSWVTGFSACAISSLSNRGSSARETTNPNVGFRLARNAD